MSLFEELKRRNVIRVGVAYGVASWLLMQMVDVLSPVFELPGWAPKLIFLILVIGFIPVIIFSWVFEMTPEGVKREAEVIRDESITNVTAKKLDYITIGLVVAGILTVVVDRFLPEQSTPAQNPVSITNESTAPVANDGAVNATHTPVIPTHTPVIPANAGIQVEILKPEAKSIAVLPFVNMSSDPEQEYFSDGISEEILNALARVKELKVAGRTSSFAFKGENQDLRQIGETLGVANILEGSVRKSGNTVRITAQLIQVSDGFHLWSDVYDRELDNGNTDESWAYLDRISPFFLDDPLIPSLKGETLLFEGHPGDALPFLETALAQEPSSRSYLEAFGASLVLSGQYERAVDTESPYIKSWALGLLDRQEEANIITAQLAATGEDVSVYLSLMVMAGEYTEVIGFFESRWSDFDAFEADFPPLGRGDISTFVDLAQAYAMVGNEQRFQQALTRLRFYLDRARELGFANMYLDRNEALYYSLASDSDKALENLARAVDNGFLCFPRMAKEFVQLKPLEGNPEYEAIQARMVQNLNEERAKLKLEPISI